MKYARRRDASVISMARRRLSRIRDTSRKVISSQAGRKRLEGSWDRGRRIRVRDTGTHSINREAARWKSIRRSGCPDSLRCHGAPNVYLASFYTRQLNCTHREF